VAARSEALDVISGSNAIPGSGGNPGSDGNAFDVSWQTGAQSWATTAPLAACDDNTCWSFAMSVAPTSASIAANDSVSVHLATVLLDSANPITLTLKPPPGVVAGQFDPTSVVPGQGVDLGFAVPLGTLPGAKGAITIIGNNGIEPTP
jgi:hypothetical protein